MPKSISLSPLHTILKLVIYNLRVIFSNRFVYFFAASLLFYLLVTIVNIFTTDVVTISDVYYLLMFPGLLFIFFPTVFGIQNDADARVLEIIFGIPNYRYKIYLVRLIIILLLQWFYMLFLASVSNFLLVNMNIVETATRIMVPLTFMGLVGFSFSTVVRNGNGTVVILIIVGLFFWILSGALENSKWNLFLNPFSQPSSMSELVWADMVRQNRNMYIVGSVVLFLWGILNLQKREGFMK